ncbi:hypothetical protein L218DRAFT_950288 [Marasmius fiardii PR-910]|nr:hypothetical protein L218DRAFT_950288 [Marasmius fiardii PR-910]
MWCLSTHLVYLTQNLEQLRTELTLSIAVANNTPSNYTNIGLLPEEQHFDGENYISWKDTMLPNGQIKGLDLYWEGKVHIPSPNTPTPYAALSAVNNPHPNPLEYSLHESVAYLTIWNNIKNPSSLGILSSKMSSELWQYLEKEYLLKEWMGRYLEKGVMLKKCGFCERPLWMPGIPEEQFITVFLNSFPHSPEWNVITGPLMMEKSFNVIVAHLQDYHLCRAGGNSQVPDIQKTSALEAALMERITRLSKLYQHPTRVSKKGDALTWYAKTPTAHQRTE